MPTNKQNNNTPLRQKQTTPARLTTSPYFPVEGSRVSTTKRKHVRDSTEEVVAHATPGKITSVKKGMRLTTSPYFDNPNTPTRWAVVSDPESEAEEKKKRERKRRRLVVRGDTPDEPPPPPSSPDALAEAMRRIRPALVQESVRDDPWKIIVATTLLNKTSGKVALPVYWELIWRWPTPVALAQAAVPIITQLLRPLGTQSVRTQRLMRFSNAYAMHPPLFLTSTPDPDIKSSGTESQTLSEETQPNFELKTTCSGSAPISSPAPFAANPPSPRPFLKPAPSYPATQTNTSSQVSESRQYLATQKSSPIAHLPFTGPYAIDSFRIFSSSLLGGGAPSRVEDQLRRVAQLPRSAKRRLERDDFDETPGWYDPALLSVEGDEDAEWRRVRPADKQLRRYLVWRWAIEGVAYDPVRGTFEPASWLYLNYLIRK